VVREFMYATEYEPPELPNSVGNNDILILDDAVFGGGQPSFSPVTPATPTAFESEPVGIVLEVLPTVDAERRYVDVTLNPSFVEFDGFINYGTPINSSVPSGLGGLTGPQQVTLTSNSILMPVFSKMRSSTGLTVADGATIAFGGLIQDSIQNVEDQTPILGSLPIVGRLFQSKVQRPMKTAIVFLVTVDLLDPSGRPLRER
jgi:general secretion pathway protein D